MGRSVDVDDLVSVSEIAAMAGVSSSAVSNWSRRHTDFPKPVVTLGGRHAYLRPEVERWLDQPIEFTVRRPPRRRA